MAEKILTLVKPNDPILLTPAKDLTEDELMALGIEGSIVDDLIATLIHLKAAGIAAPQVGISKRIFVTLSENPGLINVFVNPLIKKMSAKKVIDTEGCLSCPGKWVKIKRPKSGSVTSFNYEKGQREVLKFKGEAFRRFLHEFDHLNGVLITSYDN